MLLQIYPDMFTKSVDRFHRSIIFRGLRKYGKAYTPKRRQKLLFFRIQKKLFKSTRCREKYAHAAEVFAQADL